MKFSELIRRAGYPVPTVGNFELDVTGISADSRTVGRGQVFVALQGLNTDGNRYITEALKRGAIGVVSEREIEGVACLVVENARAALARFFDAWHAHPAGSMTLVGITGTNGKTSTAELLYAILRHAGHSVGLIGTVHCLINGQDVTPIPANRLANMTTPDPAELYALLARMREAGVTHVVMEVTSHALFFEKVAPLHFRCAVFTNLTPDHLDLHGDMESYFAEKRKLFERADRAVISTATPYGERLADGLDYALYRADACTVRRVEKRGSDGVSFCVAPGDTEPFDVFLPVPGEFAVENGALAALTAHSLGVPPAVIRQAMSSFAGVRGRMERVGENPFDISVFLDYAHTPDALEKLLLSVRGFRRPEQRIVLLFGCGGDRDRSKRAQMGRIASRLADLVILTSDNCRSEDPQAILTDILEGVDKERPYRVISDRAEAIAYAVQTARKHDILLLAGKGHEEYEIRGRQRLPFSEREIVARCMRERVEKDAN